MTQPTNSIQDPVDMVVDLLEQSADADYQNGKPARIGEIEEYSYNDRTNFSEPALYVWSPTPTNREKFSADGDHTLEDGTVEILVYVLENRALCRQYQRDVANFLAQYYDRIPDMEQHAIEPGDLEDLRNEHTTDQTDHHVMSVEVEPRLLRAE